MAMYFFFFLITFQVPETRIPGQGLQSQVRVTQAEHEAHMHSISEWWGFWGRERTWPSLGGKLYEPRRRQALCSWIFFISPEDKNLHFYLTYGIFLSVGSVLKKFKSSETSFYLAICQIRISKSFCRMPYLKVYIEYNVKFCTVP